MLANNLADHEVTDFQHYPSWRRLVPVVADEVVRFTSQDLVAAQSVLTERYWRELDAGLAGLGHEVFHVVLDADAETLHARIDADQEELERIRPWRHRHVDDQVALDGSARRPTWWWTPPRSMPSPRPNSPGSSRIELNAASATTSTGTNGARASPSTARPRAAARG